MFRDALAPLLSTRALEALRKGLADDDSRLVQGATTVPPPLPCVSSWPVEAACALGYCGVEELGGFGTATVAETEEFFARLCFEIDQRLGEPAGCRWFLNAADETPRSEFFPALLAEVDLELGRRRAEGAVLDCVVPA